MKVDSLGLVTPQMVSKSTKRWDEDTLLTAVEEIKQGKLSYRKAELEYGIPKSTLCDHATGKVEIGRRQGLKPVLTRDEEESLVQWALEMNEIGYGQTRRQICDTIKKILDKDGRHNPFTDNRPGSHWWYSFVCRNKLSLRSPSTLESYRASACTPEKLQTWYHDFEQFLVTNGLTDEPSRIWNCDESGFPLCPKSGKVLTRSGAKTVYASGSAQKQQITTLVAISASGNVIPPMHVFPGVRFSYNPMEESVPKAYFGRSVSGWINTELFYGWVEKSFCKADWCGATVLLLDGHTSHIDLDTSKFCKQDQILLYCLPPHSSHITQPLDVGFFAPLKASWRRAVDKYRNDNVGKPITKEEFTKVFKEAWTDTVSVKIVVNGFRGAGIYPVDASKIGVKVSPSAVYQVDREAASQESSATS